MTVESGPRILARTNIRSLLFVVVFCLPTGMVKPWDGGFFMRLILTTAVLLCLATTAHAGMGVSFDWGPTKKCFDSKSPPMQLSGVPEGTVKLDIRMVDRNAISFNHGGGKIAYSGNNSLPYGAFKYRGPCPPSGSHNYVFTVKALDAKGKTITTAKASKKFP